MCGAVSPPEMKSPAASGEVHKELKILKACNDGDLEALTALATSEQGLINDSIRRTAWPILLGCQRTDVSSVTRLMSSPHKDENQVALDVNRSFVYYPCNESEKQLDDRKEQLQFAITTILRRHPCLSYFQGFHDIVQVFLLVLGPDIALPAVARLSLLRIRDFMLPTMAGAISYLQLLPSILQVADADLARHLSQTQPFFALPAILTLYAHDIQEYGEIARLFDFLLAQEAVMSLYLFTTIICSRQDELLQIETDELDMLHSILSKLPRSLNLEEMILKSVDLFQRHPPHQLPSSAWNRISSYSVLKTTQNLLLLSRQTISDGEELLSKHAVDVEQSGMLAQIQAILVKFRRPTEAIVFAFLVAGIALWLNRQGYLGLNFTWPPVGLFRKLI